MQIQLSAIFLVTVAVILGWGSWLWQKIVRADGAGKSPYHPLFSLGVIWFLGYAYSEAYLSLLAAVQLFGSKTIWFASLPLYLLGLWLFFVNVRKQLKTVKFFNTNADGIFSVLILTVASGFVFFWNIYPTIDVDSLATYFAYIKNMLQNGGYYFSRFDDVRLYNPLGDNLIYAFGFSLGQGSLVYAQLIHGLSKVFLLFIGFGFGRYFGLNRAAVLVPLLMLSEEHWLASGANYYVRLNTMFVFAIGVWALGLAAWIKDRRPSAALLVIASSLMGISCKYFALPLLPIGLLVIGLTGGVTVLSHVKPLLALTPLLFGASATYIRSWIFTGSPFFPASLGPLKTTIYDQAAQTVGMLNHYRLDPRNALINFSIFTAWTRILPLKWIPAFCMANGLLLAIRRVRPTKVLTTAFALSIICVAFVMYQEMYIVFEVRYYRFPLLLQSVTFALLVAGLINQLRDVAGNAFKSVAERISETVRRVVTTAAIWGFVLLCTIYCMNYSFNVMYDTRGSAKEIGKLIVGSLTEEQILKRHHGNYIKMWNDLNAAGLNNRSTGYFTIFSWPAFLSPLEGLNLSFFQTAAMPSYMYFDEGSFAAELVQLGIKRIINQKINASYPIGSKAVFSVISKCGKKVPDKAYLLDLNEKCLSKLAEKSDTKKAIAYMEQAIAELVKRPKYEPFVPPWYNGLSGL